MRFSKVCSFLVSFLLMNSALAQLDSTYVSSKSERHVELGGYLKYMNITMIPEFKSNWMFDNLIHHRMNFNWKMNKEWQLDISIRNRIFFGQSVQNNPQFPKQFDLSLDYVDLGTNLIESQSLILHTVFDRANVSWKKNNWLMILGKQRINWSQSYVWNPNDIFNAYSFFDFDYEERRGSDAFFLQYELSPLSSLQFAVSIHDEVDSLITAAYYRFNKLGYDIQMIGGKYQTDVYAGFGWSGQIKAIGFRGEMSYFQPYKSSGTNPTFLSDVSFDYRFQSSLILRLEAIYNSNPSFTSPATFFQIPVTTKNLTFNHFSIFAGADYEITPLLKIGVNSIINIDDESWFINPTLSSSLNKNTELLIALQNFAGSTGTLYSGMGNILYTRLKLNF